MDHVPAGKLNAAVRRWTDLSDLARRVRRRSVDLAMFFHFRPGVKRYIPVALKPWIVTEKQRRELRRRCMVLEHAARRVLAVRATRRDVRELLPFTEGEERWMHDAYRGDFARPETCFSRMDVATDLGRADWLDRARFLEANLVGIGATYYSWCAGRIAAELFAPRLEKALGLRLRAEDDILDMILRRCRAHGARIGRPDPTVAFLEHKRVEHGPFEYQTMERIFRERGGKVVVADPVELRRRGGEICFGGTRVDILYRDPTLLELVEMEEDGDDLRAVRFAFRENRVVSSLGGEADQKSLFELFSSAKYRDLFTPAERAVFRRHVPWTRLLRGTRTEDPAGRDVDLVGFVRTRRERLILKPNRDYGGSGITIGNAVGAAEWDRAIEKGLAAPGGVVAQERIEFNTDVYPVLEGGRVRFEDRYIVTGVHAGDDESAFLARMSAEPIVNITRGGAIVGVLVANG
ncbi:MAG: hypothetical protein HYY17_14760 [Planctomycetes bacterium]|nr:hypothetical protein [Planctomycetota bacterium]